MSPRAPARMTVPELVDWKGKGRRIPVLTCYDATFARILDQCRIPVLLVGDSLGQVILGHESTLPVTLEAMIHHTRAVSRARPWGLVVADMPFLSFQVSPERALEAAGRLVREGRADAVKIEGGERSAAAVRMLVDAGIPVMGHLGLTPQSILAFGGYGVRGRAAGEGEAIRRDARALEQAGCFAIVLEAIPAALAREITGALRIPTIGIGAGPGCDGQVLVLYDMLGLFTEFKPRFVRRFVEGAEVVAGAVRAYAEAVAAGEFPAPEHCADPAGPVAEAPAGSAADKAAGPAREAQAGSVADKAAGPAGEAPAGPAVGGREASAPKASPGRGAEGPSGPRQRRGQGGAA
ncbi:MAG: 3-methyl-2-oxobutanoate hydroxymethyltransferase [Candidatus Eisenbacteria bacterium]|uniref:3-methyl-2-oxobutanoate hydroxymethyltransferase n=1 Tax=Eiseniibacteriota bacterium TaxID=2212470 RepID=A0A938BNJ5_UNCEI|nr:3-methyl-2-oxobutanoate hydroxymethyltransferase [Candidatus Eisenbacteria bacterium]